MTGDASGLTNTKRNGEKHYFMSFRTR